MCLELSRTLFTVDDGSAGPLADHRLQPIVRRQLDHPEDIELPLGLRAGDVRQRRTPPMLANLLPVVGVVGDVADWVGDPAPDDVPGETPLALGDPYPPIERPARFGVGDEPLPMLRHAPVTHSSGVVAMFHPP